jgi:hypothetical protein
VEATGTFMGWKQEVQERGWRSKWVHWERPREERD